MANSVPYLGDVTGLMATANWGGVENPDFYEVSLENGP